MKHRSFSYLSGPNQYSKRSVAVLTIDLGKLARLLSAKVGQGFAKRCLSFLDRVGLPNLEGRTRQELRARLTSEHGVPLCEVVLYLILALEGSSAGEKTYALAIEEAEPSHCRLIWGSSDEQISLKASKLALLCLRDLLPNRLKWATRQEDTDIESQVRALKAEISRRRPHTDDLFIRKSAEQRDIPWEGIGKRFTILGQGKFQKRVRCSVTSDTRHVAAQAASNKDIAHRLLEDLCLPVPSQEVVSTEAEAVTASQQIGYPVVVKPLGGREGRNVSANLNSDDEVRSAFALAGKGNRQVVVESHVAGSDFRLLVVGNQMLAAVKRVPPSVVGDGRQTIQELVRELNRDPGRDGKKLYQVKISDDTQRLLETAGYTSTTVLKKGEEFVLCSTANFSTGGIPIDVTQEVHPENKKMAVQAAHAIGLDVAGIDFLTTDITRSYRQVGGAIIEVNALPGLRLHYWPAEGPARDVTGPIIDLMFPPNCQSRVPIALVTGESERSLTARILSHILQLAGVVVGLSTQNQVYIGGDAAGPEQFTEPGAVRTMLRDSRVEAIVRDVAPAEILKHGLCHDACNVTALLDLESDSDTENNQTVARLLCDVARDWLVVNSNSPVAVELVSDLSSAGICYVAEKPENKTIRRQIGAGGRAVLLETLAGKENFAFIEKGENVCSIPTSVLKFTKAWGKRSAAIHASLFASAIAWSMGVEFDDIRTGLETLGANVFVSPIRAKVLSGDAGKFIIADSADQESVQTVLMLLGQLGPVQDENRILALLTSDAAASSGFQSGSVSIPSLLDLYVCRGEESARLFIDAGIDANRIQVLPEEGHALDAVTISAGPQSVTGIVCDDVEYCAELIEQHRTAALPAPSAGDACSNTSLKTGNYETEKQPDQLWSGAELANATGGEWIPPGGIQLSATGFDYLPSRLKPGDVALTFNPVQWEAKHNYSDLVEKLPTLFEAGAVGAIVHRIPKDWPEEFPLLLVEDTRKALDRLGAAGRQRFTGKVVAITGSVGKTTTREILCHVLNKQAPTFGTIGNRNDPRGVPTMLAKVSPEYSYCVLETAISARRLAKSIKPHVIVVTTIQSDHLEFFYTLEGIADAKSKYFDGLAAGGTVILNKDIPLFERLKLAAMNKGVGRIVTYGADQDADVKLLDCRVTSQGSNVKAALYGQQIDYDVPLSGRHVILNTLAAIAAVEALGADWRQAIDDITSLEPLSKRFNRNRIDYRHGYIDFIDDSFSSNPASLKAGLDAAEMIEVEPPGRRLAILGEIGELGRNSAAIHSGLADLLLKSQIDHLITTGALMVHLMNALPEGYSAFHTNDPIALRDAVLKFIRPGDLVYIKGSNHDRDTVGYIADVLRSLGSGRKVPIPKPRRDRQSAVGEASVPTAEIEPDIVIDETKRRGQLELLLIGDTGFGENYQQRLEERGRKNILKEKGYDYPLSRMRETLLSADLVIANLETPVTDLDVSPFAGMKDYVHWGHVEHTPHHLGTHNIQCVCLANNHTFDFGPAGFEQTLQILRKKGFTLFGAGENLVEAAKPLVVQASIGKHTFHVAFVPAFEVSRHYREKYDCYATKKAGGIAPLDAKRMADEIQRLKQAYPGLYIVAFPHWGDNYKWRNPSQAKAADMLIEAGVDLIVGHGSHMIQEIEQRGGRWVIYSLGNFMFNSPGRYKKLDAPPYSFMANLRVADEAEELGLGLRLHPIFTDNLRNGYRTRFLKRAEFDEVVNLLFAQSPAPTTLHQYMKTGTDDIGRYLEFDLGIAPSFHTGSAPVKTHERQPVVEGKTTCLECGRKFKALHIHLKRTHKMKTSEYLTKWGLQEIGSPDASSVSVEN